MSAVVVVPSYNERENLVELLEAILAVAPDARVCVVDDSSPDGTAAVVRDAIAARDGWADRVHLLVRSAKDGRGGAVHAGLVWGFGRDPDADVFVEMDADFSHAPSALPEGIRRVRAGADVVVGARYPDGTIIGWSWQRRVFSKLANALARAVIERSVGDYTNGFRFYSRRAAARLLERAPAHRGYIYLSEAMAKLLSAKMRVESFPIVFRNRERGKSNTGLAEIAAALRGIAAVGWNYRRGRS